MMNNLFSTFDPSSSLFHSSWLISMPIILMMIPHTWMKSNILNKISNSLIIFLKNEIKYSMGKPEKSTLIMIMTLFLSIILMNVIALFPQNFSLTSHLTINLPLATTFWMILMMNGWMNNPNHMLSHLVPQGTPSFLMMFMVTIELISNTIRPITLCVRLTANLLAGHLLMTLLGNLLSSLSAIFASILIFIPLLLTMLETAVACIQAYVFMTLITMYTTEIK